MKKLYIIGNGFDVAHGLHTDYWTFRTYLEHNYPEFLMAFEKMYSIEPLDDTEPWYTENDQERWNQAVNRNLWSNFEESMGQPDITSMLGISSSVLDSMYLDGGNIGIQDTMDVYWREQFGFISQLHTYLKEWIEQIDTSAVLPMKKGLISNNEDWFLNFNYTDVLEHTYQIENVAHIHGGVESVSGNPPIMGHCNNDEIAKHRQFAKNADEEYDEGESSIQSAIADYLDAILKDTDSIIRVHNEFFDSLSTIRHIAIVGWSIGNVDIPYLLRIKEQVRDDAQWTVYWYNDAAYTHIRKVFADVGIEENYHVEYIKTDKFWDNAV